MTHDSRFDADIYIVGLGILNIDHITKETERILKQCEEVLYVDTGVATGPYLASLCPKVTNLFGQSYSPGDSRINAYHHMAAKVIESAMSHRPVAFAMYGHPTVFAYAPFLILDLAKQLGLTVKVLPGISAMDCLFAELMVDPSVNGLQIYEATDLLLRKRPLEPTVPALIWQVGNLESRLYTGKISKPERFFRFVKMLLNWYPEDHPITAFYSTPHPLVPSTTYRFTLKDLPSYAHVLDPNYTLYLPPTHTRAIQDMELLGLIDSPQHLSKVTR